MAYERPEWLKLEKHFKKMRKKHLRDLFKKDPKRAKRFSLTLDDGLFLDYSKNRISPKTMNLLIDLAKASGLRSSIRDMFDGKPINKTEGRAVLHTALRNQTQQDIPHADAEDLAELKKVKAK